MGSGGRRFRRHDGERDPGAGRALRVLEALERLDPSTVALLDLSLRWGIGDERIAEIGQTDLIELHETRAEALRVVTDGIDAPPAESLELVRDALGLLFGDEPPEAGGGQPLASSAS